MIDNNQIPTVPIYGDESIIEAVDLLHIEPLLTRSREYRFTIKPHRHPHMTQLFLLQQGSGMVRLDGVEHNFSAPCVIIIASMCVHEFNWSSDIKGSVLTCSNALLQRSNATGNNQVLETQIISQPLYFDQLIHVLKIVSLEYQQASLSLHRDHSFEAMMQLVITWISRQTQHDPVSDHGKRKQPLLTQYQELIDEYYAEHWHVADYAKTLNVTAPHLNSICRRHANTNAQQLIHRRVILEAKRNLTYTVLTVNQVSDSLGFQDPGYFNRFFKRHTGMTPKQYRNQS